MSAGLGTVLDERFDLRRHVGAGAMGVVYEAWDRQTEKPVAIKVLRIGGTVGTQRFLREGAILAELDHPAIVRYVTQRISSEGESYLVMEWLEGQTLEDKLRSGPLSILDGLVLARRVVDALVMAHRQGIVHRDLKPSNLFLPAGVVGEAKILDFGIAWRIWDEQRLTETGATLGTPLYMAPEQAHGDGRVDQRADIYALGAVLFECFTGRPPFTGATTMAILCKICLEEPPRLKHLVPGVPDPLDVLLRSMLAKDPAARPSDTMTLANALANIHPWTSSTVTSRPPPVALSDAEQRVVCVILVGARAVKAPTVDDPGGAASPLLVVPPRREVEARLADIDDALSVHDARLEQLLDGSMVITFPPAASPTDQAAVTARCALSLRGQLPDAPIVVCTGRATVSGRTPMGDVVDRGVALLQAARTGSIRLDTVTTSLLDARFEIEEGDEGVYLKAERELGEAPRTVLGRSVPCLGREKELTLLQGIFSDVVGDSEARAVLVTAPAGTGKSRLRQELVDRLGRGGNNFELLLGRTDALRAGSPFGLLAASIRWAAAVSADDSPDARRQKLRARLSRHLSGDQAARVGEFLGELAGIAFLDKASAALRSARQDARTMGDQMRAAWLDWLGAECEARPVLLVLEDLHWSDAPSVQLLDASLRALRERPLMILALARPEVNERFPRIWEDRGAQTLPLVPLTRKACEGLVAAVLGKDVPPELVKRIVAHADGNPFFLEELLRGVAGGQTQLPETVIGMVQIRLDKLGADTSRVLRAASVFGEAFSFQGVSSLLGLTGGVDVETTIHKLVEREVVLPRQDSGPREYAFQHALVREASYATLTDEDRVLGHRLAGEWLEKSGETDAMVLAEHFDRGNDRSRAAAWYAKAGAQALQGDDLEAAIARAERAIACGASGETLSEISVVEAQARYWRAEFGPAAVAARRAILHVPVGSAAWFHALREIVGPHTDQGENDEVAKWARMALEATPTTPEADEAQVACLSWTAGALAHDGQHALAQSLLDRAQATLVTLATPDPWAVLRFHYARAILFSSRGSVMAAISEFELALAASEEAGDMRTSCGIRVELSTNWTEVGEPERAEALVRRALADAKQRALGLVESFTLPALANILICLRRPEEARVPLEQTIELANKSGSTWALGLANFVWAALAHATGDWALSELRARSAVEYFRGNRGPLPASLSALARALLAQGRKAEAFEASREAMVILEELGGAWFESLVRLISAETRMAVGDDEGARVAIRLARDRILEQSKQISAPSIRANFLSRVAENARTLELAQAWGETGCEARRLRES